MAKIYRFHRAAPVHADNLHQLSATRPSLVLVILLAVVGMMLAPREMLIEWRRK